LVWIELSITLLPEVDCYTCEQVHTKLTSTGDLNFQVLSVRIFNEIIQWFHSHHTTIACHRHTIDVDSNFTPVNHVL